MGLYEALRAFGESLGTLPDKARWLLCAVVVVHAFLSGVTASATLRVVRHPETARKQTGWESLLVRCSLTRAAWFWAVWAAVGISALVHLLTGVVLLASWGSGIETVFSSTRSRGTIGYAPMIGLGAAAWTLYGLLRARSGVRSGAVATT